jgi:hypothetical protein
VRTCKVRYERGDRMYDRAVTYERLERRFRRILDRRRNYCVVRGELCEAGHWSQECSGCYGSGCEECGYQGKIRVGMWIPVEVCEGLRRENK